MLLISSYKLHRKEKLPLIPSRIIAFVGYDEITGAIKTHVRNFGSSSKWVDITGVGSF
jgi:hypothetical protein